MLSIVIIASKSNKKLIKLTLSEFLFGLDIMNYSFKDKYNKDDYTILIVDNNNLDKISNYYHFYKTHLVIYSNNVHKRDLSKSYLPYYLISTKYDLCKTVLKIINEIENLHILKVNINKDIYYLEYSKINYIVRDKTLRKIIISYGDKEIVVNDSLDSINNQAKGYFFRSHRSCLVNIYNINYVTENNIVFKNNLSIDYLSRSSKSKLISHFRQR